MSRAKKPTYPVRPAELIGKGQDKAAIVDADNDFIRKCGTYEDAETLAMIMNHVHEVWEPRFKALERREKK